MNARMKIVTAVEAEAPSVPFTMPFFLAGLLLKECRRQKLKNLDYTGPDYRVSVRIRNFKPVNQKTKTTNETTSQSR